MLHLNRSHVPASKQLLSVAIAMVLGSSAMAETLEERVTKLEEGESRQTDTLNMLTEFVKRTDVSGFLSLRGGRIQEHGVTYMNILDDQWRFSEESVAGLQLNSHLSDEVSLSIQLKSSTGGSGVELEWGYLEYAPRSDMKFRAGRLRVPGFMLSEFLDVGYAVPWVSVPNEVYGWNPFSRYEGMDMRYWTSVGDIDIRLNPYLGTTSKQSLAMGNIDYTNQESEFAGLDLQFTYDIFTLRAGYSKYKFTLSDCIFDTYLNALVNGVTLVPDIPGYVDPVAIPGLSFYVEDVMVDALQQIIDSLTPPDPFIFLLQGEQASLMEQLANYENIPALGGDHDGEFYGVGFSIDNGNFMFMSEISRSAIEGAYPDVESGYVMFGYRFGNWMPHLTFAKMYTVNDDPALSYLSEFDLNDLVWSLDPGLTALAGGVEMFTGALSQVSKVIRMEQESYTLGVRWDPAPGLAVKTDLFMVKPRNGSHGLVIPTDVGELASSDFSTFAVTSDVSVPPPVDSIRGLRVSVDLIF